jgi:cell division protein YceG involved in septum cleavage
VPFLFFVAQPDGKHIFSVTYAEHEAAIRAVKRMQTESRGRRLPGR